MSYTFQGKLYVVYMFQGRLTFTGSVHILGLAFM